MKPRTILAGNYGTYDVVAWSGKNVSGWTPIGDRVLVLPDQPSMETPGRIKIPDEVLDRNAHGAETGVIVALGPDAFKWSFDRTRPFDSEPPKVGEHVYFERYAGQIVHGADKVLYRLMDDKCIGCILDKEDAA